MDFGFSYLQGRIRDATKSWQCTLDYNDEARLIRKANKISTVFNIMSFCQGECKLSFYDSSSESKNSINGCSISESNEEICFQSCTSKTFEVKQVESFEYDKYCRESDIE